MKKQLLFSLLVFIITPILFAAEPRTQLNFDDVEVLSVIKLMGKVTGKSFVFNNRDLKGKKITLLSNQRFTATEAYKIFEGILDINELTLIEEGKTFRIVQSKNAKNIPVPLYDPDDKSVSSSFVTRVIPVLHADAKTIRASLAPLVSRSALLIVLTGLNALILKDTRDNTDQFAKLVKMLDEMDDPIMSVSMEVVPVTHANANELTNLLNKIFTTVVPKGGGKVKLKISADNRTNSIIVIGQAKSIQKIKSLVQQLDSKDEVNFGSINVLSLTMEIIPVKHANANDIAALISKIFASKKPVKQGEQAISELKIYGYERTNNIIVVAHPKLTEKIKTVIGQLDTEADVDGENVRILSLNLELIPIKHANAEHIAELILKMFTPQKTGKKDAPGTSDPKLRIFADKRTNNIIMVAHPKLTEKIKTVIEQLDIEENVDSENIRILSLNLELIPIKYANAEHIAELISKMFNLPKKVDKKDAPVSTDPKLRIFADKRTNNIMVIAHPKLTDKVKTVIEQLDIEENIDSENIRILSLNLEMIPIKYANATDIVELISKMFDPQKKVDEKDAPVSSDPKLRIFADKRTNNVFIIAHPKLIAKIKEVIEQIDTIDEVDSENVRILSLNLEIIPIKFANAEDIADLISKMFTQLKTDEKSVPVLSNQKLRVFADKRTNNVILIGFPQTLEKIKKIVGQLDNKIDIAQGNIRVYQLKNANAKNIAEVLQKVSKTFKKPDEENKLNQTTGTSEEITIIPDIPTNSLVIYANQNDFLSLENVLEELDVARPQVFIQALIMEVKLDKSLDLGIEWQAGDLTVVGGRESLVTAGGVGSTGGPSSFPPQPSGSSGAVIGVVGGPITFGGQEFSSFNAFIKATETDSEIDILSNPKILTLNNEEAEIKVAEIIPTIGSTKIDANGNATTSVDYKEVGVLLKITPQINSDKTVELQIEQTSSNIIDGKVGAYENSAITTLNRTLKAKVNVYDGQTIALGGLIHEDLTEVHTKTPCLGDIPILGWLFKTKSTRAKKTNLLIFLTPRIVTTHQDIAEFTNEAKIKNKNARLGRFRIDVTKEFDIPVMKADEEDILEEEAELAQEKAEEEAELAEEAAELAREKAEEAAELAREKAEEEAELAKEKEEAEDSEE